jgi:hypothetical protein
LGKNQRTLSDLWQSNLWQDDSMLLVNDKIMSNRKGLEYEEQIEAIIGLVFLLCTVILGICRRRACPATEKAHPRIMGDDIGWFNPSCYNRGMMGLGPRTSTGLPRSAVHHLHAQQSCTRRRAAFITGNRPSALD